MTNAGRRREITIIKQPKERVGLTSRDYRLMETRQDEELFLSEVLHAVSPSRQRPIKPDSSMRRKYRKYNQVQILRNDYKSKWGPMAMLGPD
jgi:hypothetical protein